MALVLVLAVATAGEWARDKAIAPASRQAGEAAALRAAVLDAELDKQRSLPVVLAADPDVATTLRTRQAARISALNAKLEMLSAQTGAAVIYLLDTRGIAVAASNWRTDQSFIGSNYAFRPYYRKAMTSGAAEDFALGTVSRIPGLYLARRIDDGGRALGAIVVKVEFGALEAAWGKLAEPAFITDERGVVLISSVPAWRFNVLGGLGDTEKAAIRASRQLGDATLARLPLSGAAGSPVLRADLGREDRYVPARTPVAADGWTLWVLAPVGSATDAAVNSARTLALLLSLVLAGLAAAALLLIGRARRRASLQAAAQAELEARVAARTHDLSDANSRLQDEMDARRRAAIELQRLQDELVQANKLASLGQIAAGVAHEINQPVAAIRAYADNAGVLLGRGETLSARQNMGRIADLTERIGSITEALKSLARKKSIQTSPVSLAAALDGAFMLLGHRPARQGVRIERTGADPEIDVLGDRLRIEQVLVNLLQNALDALEARPDPVMRVAVQADASKVLVAVSDNGPGLPPDVAAALFTPFVTTKPQGLGLGLVISRDIAQEMGGDLRGETGPDGGACFTLTLRRAP